MDTTEVEKAKAFIIVEIIEYVPNSVVIKTIIKKTTGNVTAVSIDSGEALTEKIIPFDTFVQIIDGNAEIIIDGVSNFLKTGDSIIIPAHTPNSIKANERFKMISTIIKSGYE
jgi:quercetin dioxygenase-like cupin family protein